MEYALFIKAKIAEGIKGAEIARRLGRDRAWVTHHSALADLPECLEVLYRTERCTSAFYLYELRNLHRSFPDQVDAWCQGDHEVTRKAVAELGRILKASGDSQTDIAGGLAAASVAPTGHLGMAEDRPLGGGNQSLAEASSGDTVETSEDRKGLVGSGADVTTSASDALPAPAAKATAKRTTAPLVRVKVKDRYGVLDVLNVPPARGNVFVRFEGQDSAEEVAGKACTLLGVWSEDGN